MSHERHQRYLEVDFFRGLALLIIFWNHLLYLVQGAGLLKQVPLRLHYGYSDQATVFALLSGFVTGIVYSKHLDCGGLVLCYQKALKRIGQIYFAQCATFIVLIASALLIPHLSSIDPVRQPVREFLGHPDLVLFKFVTLQSFLIPYLDILPLYMAILLVAPVILFGLKRSLRSAFALSFTLYVAVQVLIYLNVPFPFEHWFVNPLAWQFLFFLGLLAGAYHRNVGAYLPRKRSLALVAVAVALYALLSLRGIANLTHVTQNMVEQFHSVFPNPLPFTDKRNLEPFHLIHFLCVAYLVWVALPKLKNILATGFARLLIACGQHSLPLFCFGVFCDYYFGAAIVRLGGSTQMFVVFGVLGWILSMAFGGILSMRDKGMIKSIRVGTV